MKTNLEAARARKRAQKVNFVKHMHSRKFRNGRKLRLLVWSSSY